MLAAALPLGAAAQGQGLQVFACEPEWAALVKALAPQAQVTAATHARQDAHHIEARPALIAALRRAHLAVCTGASLEVGWLPMLQARAGNAAVRDGQPGMFYAAQQVELIDRRASVGFNDGDVHPEGNPHFHLDPARLAQVARALSQRLAQIDPPQAAAYAARHTAWQADWARGTAQWQQRAAPLKGQRVVGQHNTFAYLWHWLGVQQIADLEPKPGTPPTPSHLQSVLAQVRQAPPIAITHALYQDAQPAQWLARQLGEDKVAVLALPSTVTDDGPSADLASWMDALVTQLLKTLPAR
ncbi:metal ABC transporter substrate-binding protein [Ottowia testudinis]|uniref:metal ABC transporter substrate-binding protein n=1 Tax=Ottowia testudinis TaxID=2816950 RepID=UPI001FB137DB|nr:zinc ABC transporter substrate-binding protein [Ottowia testudinis]